MSSDNELPDMKCPGDKTLGTKAYIIVDDANCLYAPNLESAIRVTPPYGTEVTVVRDEGFWVVIRFCGKDAWCSRDNLYACLIPRRPAVDVGVVPSVDYTVRSLQLHEAQRAPNVEYGPRGGRFIRTALGFRRYF